jgi:hypothetical protein
MASENTKTIFSDLVTFDVESGLRLPNLHQTIKTFNEDEETLSLDVWNQYQQVLANFNQKEIYIIELLGSMGKLLSSEEIAANLKGLPK